ncbi:RuvC Holliday junction resolvase [Bacillus phage Slash]|uniref:RuvC Holliday junction resolvase n=1 Tax=Bacillus phage Slash TaxID=1406790 RepID=U5PX34_9CAUD|nr:RuvC Holliday junction resolvase [Bacillus phage Slash]AGY48351.1 RuvC Holliday junction resolvase [Bacillus phage Slash]
MFLICLDPSLNSYGYAIFDIRNKPKLLNYGHINNNHFETKDEGKKLIHLEMFLSTLRQNYFPHKVVKEEWVNQAGLSGYKLALVHGITNKVFAFSEVEELNNKSFKKDFTGNGSASKEDVENEVKKYSKRIWHKNKELNFLTDDASDSVGIGIHWLVQNDYLPKL